MFKLDLEKAGEPEIKLPTSVGSTEFHINIYFYFTDFAKALTVWITTNCGKFLEMGIAYHPTCLLIDLYAGQEVTDRTGHETMGWFKIGKGAPQVYILSSCLFDLYSEYVI